MDAANWVSLAGVVVALGLGLWGVWRDRGERDQARKWRDSEQARNLVCWFEPQRDGGVLWLANGGVLPIVGAEIVVMGTNPENGDLEEYAMRFPTVVAGGREPLTLDSIQYNASEDPLRITFIDANGLRWRGTPGEPFQRASSV